MLAPAHSKDQAWQKIKLGKIPMAKGHGSTLRINFIFSLPGIFKNSQIQNNASGRFPINVKTNNPLTIFNKTWCLQPVLPAITSSLFKQHIFSSYSGRYFVSFRATKHGITAIASFRIGTGVSLEPCSSAMIVQFTSCGLTLSP